MKSERIILDINDMPRKWYNIQPDLPEPLPPPLHPATNEPIGPEDLAPLFPMELIKQEVSQERYIDIPEEVQDAYIQLGRPTPLCRAKRLEEYLKTPAKIFYKREDVSLAGSHKPNTAIPQAYYNMKEGVEELTTETGAGQWGTALAIGGGMFGLKVTVFMVNISYNQKPYRRILMNLYGAECIPSPSPRTEYGKAIRAQDPEHPGSLGIAISEAIEMAVSSEGKTKYSLGSVLNHVMLHQSVIGEETLMQLGSIDEKPDVMIGCVGGGSNFAGFTYPAMGKVLRGEMKDITFIGAEPKSCPTLTQGEYRYDHGDTAGMTPLLKMYTLGKDFIPSSIHAGGLRYHGESPSVSLLLKHGMFQAVAYDQLETFEAGKIFTQCEGLVPAPETNHAVKAAIDQALECKRTGEEKTIVFNLSGHGFLDLVGYQDFLEGKLKPGALMN